MRMNRLGSQALAGLFALIGAGLAVAAEARQTISVAALGDLRNIDPLLGTDNMTLRHGFFIYDQLFALDSRFEPQLQMLQRHEISADGLVHTMTLRPGLKWHDGQPVTAADCIASLRRWGAKDGEGKTLIANTKTLEAVDERTIRWELTRPSFSFARSLGKSANYPAFMMPARLAATPADKAVTENIGSGPFKFAQAEWRPGLKWIYEKNADYAPRSEPSDGYAGSREAHVDRVEMNFIPDEATRVSALSTGEIDLIEVVSADMAGALEANPDVQVQTMSAAGLSVVLRFNMKQPPFNNEKLRQAVLLATDQKAYMAAIAGDPKYWRTCASMFYCGLGFDPETGPFKLGGAPDIAKAKQLVAESGYKDEKVVILQASDHVMSSLALVAAQSLRGIGLNVELQTMDYSSVMQRRSNRGPVSEGGWSIFFTRWEAAFQSPTEFSPIDGACDQGWFGWYCSPEAAKLRAAWASESDAAKRRAILDDINALVVKEAPYVNLGQMVSPIAARKTIVNIPNTPILVYWTIGKK